VDGTPLTAAALLKSYEVLKIKWREHRCVGASSKAPNAKSNTAKIRIE
jgi:hypothetical protein